MIHGVGLDLVEIERVEVVLRRWGERFARRVLAPAELEEWRAAARPERFLAKRFAVKEAATKALGTGVSGGVSLRDIAVVHDPLGRPGLEFRGATLELVSRLGIKGAHVSISDERQLAAAVVVLEAAG